jgi:hypothetical protein
MKRITFSLVAVGALAGAVASFTPASGHPDEEASPIYGVTKSLRTSCLHLFINASHRIDIVKIDDLRSS